MVYNGGGGGKYWLAGLLVSVGIFAVIYFTVIKPTTDTANDVLRTSLQQSQQQLNEAKKSAPDAQSKKELSQAEKLTACLQDAGTDVSKVQDCQAKFTP
jgi:F0F1-type ATP synthase membrane subunit b/b'